MAQTPSARRAAQRRQQRPKPKVPGPGRYAAIAVGVAGVIAIVLWLVFFRGGGSSAGSASPAPASDLGPAPDYSGHPVIDNIPCEQTERVTYHEHAHLAIFVNGAAKGVPYGIGIAAPRQTQSTPDGPFVVSGSCFYWLHTHDGTGVIHMEAPNPMNFTLGQVFDMWQQPLSATQVGPVQGPVYAYVDGQLYNGDPKAIPLARHTLVQLDLGQNSPAPQPYTFAQGL